MYKNNQSLIDSLKALPFVEPPPPWRLVAMHPIGGLTDVGYAEDSDLLLVVSSAGRGVFNCLTGELVARKREPPYEAEEWYFGSRLKAIGIGPLENREIKIAGLFGGGLPLVTQDGWSIEIAYLNWPDATLMLLMPSKSIFDGIEFSFKLINSDICEFRACGFSYTGASFVFATSCDLYIFSRPLGSISISESL